MSTAERTVAGFLSETGIWWEFESAVYIMDDKGRPRVWTPDFYLPELGMYVEVVGNEELNRYDWREQVYAMNKIPIIFIYMNRFRYNEWCDYLVNAIMQLHQQRWERIKHLR
jgi:hypothetical protein